jgi:hemolysin III
MPVKHPEEEKWNSITHAVGLGLFLVASCYCTSLVEKWYCLGISFTMLLSVLYHGVENARLKEVFRMLDMVSIHILIAVTSICYLVSYGGNVLQCLLPAASGLACALYVFRKYNTFSVQRGAVSLYILSGILCLTSVAVVSGNAHYGSFCYFIVGIVVYLLGLVFYLRDHKKWYHTMWHLFVLFGGILHLVGLDTI